jgi:hypothetical protein
MQEEKKMDKRRIGLQTNSLNMVTVPSLDRSFTIMASRLIHETILEI